MAINATATTKNDDWPLARGGAQEAKHAQGDWNQQAPTVLTSQISVFGPVTSIKLSMCTMGHTAVMKMYDACATRSGLKFSRVAEGS